MLATLKLPPGRWFSLFPLSYSDLITHEKNLHRNYLISPTRGKDKGDERRNCFNLDKLLGLPGVRMWVFSSFLCPGVSVNLICDIFKPHPPGGKLFMASAISIYVRQRVA